MLEGPMATIIAVAAANKEARVNQHFLTLSAERKLKELGIVLY